MATLRVEVIEERITALLRGLPDAHPVACCAGSAGGEVPDARDRLDGLLRRLLPGCVVSVVHDARLVLAAAGMRSGIALIAGTGSVAYGRAEDGREARRGGWGWMLGDEGGAVWITREAAREVMRRADAGEPLGALGNALMDACGAQDPLDLRERLHARREPMEWASLAPAVFACAGADAGSAAIVKRAAVALGELVRSVSSSLDLDGPVVLAGGLLLNEPELESAVRAELGTRCIRLEEPPVQGAVRLAAEMLAD